MSATYVAPNIAESARIAVNDSVSAVANYMLVRLHRPALAFLNAHSRDDLDALVGFHVSTRSCLNGFATLTALPDLVHQAWVFADGLAEHCRWHVGRFKEGFNFVEECHARAFHSAACVGQRSLPLAGLWVHALHIGASHVPLPTFQSHKRSPRFPHDAHFIGRRPRVQIKPRAPFSSWIGVQFIAPSPKEGAALHRLPNKA